MSRIKRFRQVVDWRAAILSGIVSGILFLVVQMLLAWQAAETDNGLWLPIRMIAAIFLGDEVIPSTFPLSGKIVAVGVGTHMIFAVAAACLLAIIIHKWGIVVGFFGGAAFGFGLYIINYFFTSKFFPWFENAQNYVMAVSHIAFGAIAGSVYEMLEVERWVAVDEPASTTGSS